jgi:hypothetical protein
MRRVGTLVAALAVMSFVNPVFAQRQRASPHETTTAALGSAKIEITYGRPFKKGRDVWNGAVTQAPSKDVWRMGADEATTLKTSADITIGNLKVPAGEYTLFFAHGADAGSLIVNKQTGQWGMSYDAKQDLGRVELKQEKNASPVEQLTISVEPQGSNGTLKIAWDDRTYSAPISAQ